MKKPLIIITGPTASGKTDVSVKLAGRLNAEIISADSMQIYKYMDIGSAKIAPEEMQGIRHYLVDELMPEDEFHVVKFQQMALKAMNEIYSKGKIPMIVGGTGFYIQALLYNIDFEDTHEDTEYREYLEKAASDNPPGWLSDMLKKADPASAAAIHPNNTKRLIRALEYFHLTGKPISAHNEEQRQKSSPYCFRYFVLNRDRAELYRRIDRRVDLMMERGLPDEVRRLKDMGYTRDMVSMQGLGYKELLDYFDGKCTLEEAVNEIKESTRHFAKRQLTWFRRERDVTWVNADGLSVNELTDILEKECRIMLTEEVDK